ncbi:PTS mannitol transporter subunit IICBA [Chakrabartyella piscis]|uniref:PTS mannitol transporter subunit IICBA n=1 Tax=Chakrabartyella piscis TaxID=2918914 RepID=UPI002958499B|nr:PTS mannitol transporter subunit IICBA [Chakrabartyella piscis]
MKNGVQKFGKFLSGMIMPNIGALIAWGLITALFIEAGWFPNAGLATMVDPILYYLLPILIAYQGGKMVGGDRGAIMGAIATMGVVCGAEQAMLIGGMVMGPVGGLVIKKFDEAVDGKIPAGFEMLINNFSIGILGMILAIIGYFMIGPVMSAVLVVLSGGVQVLVEKNLLPFVAIFIEPAKVLFLNNAINHGIFTPIGIEQTAETGKSIMYMLESNPGPGLGILIAYWMFSKDKVTKSSAPGAAIIHLFGGIHEIYFPYVLMNPIIIIAPIVSSIVTIFYYTIFNAGLVAPSSPGSIIAYLAVAPKGETLIVLGGVLIAAVISFLIASPIVKLSGGKDIDAATAKMKDMKAESKGLEAKPFDKVNKIVFSCDAGMGSSAMGATKFRNRIAPLGLGITVINTSVDNVPADADIVVCQEILQDRAKKSAPQARLVTIANFLADGNLDQLYAELERLQVKETEVKEEVAPVVEEEKKAVDNSDIMQKAGIQLGLTSVDKDDAIRQTGRLLHELGYVGESYIEAMVDREHIATTYLGFGVAIPHGTSAAKGEVKRTGIVMLQFPEGIDFGEEKATLMFGIAGVGDEHLELLGKIGEVIEEDDKMERLKAATSIDEVYEMFQ